MKLQIHKRETASTREGAFTFLKRLKKEIEKSASAPPPGECMRKRPNFENNEDTIEKSASAPPPWRYLKEQEAEGHLEL